MEILLLFAQYTLLETANGKQPNILYHLKEIAFPALREIVLYENKVECIEPLVQLRTPLLEKLFISSPRLIQTTTGSTASGY